MPLTFAHPAAVLPLRRRGLVLSALVIGSMAPDFEYFFGLAHPASHSMPGVLTFTLPVALLALVIFHEIVKWPLISLLPRGLQARVLGPARGFRWFPILRFSAVLASLAIGIATHIVWDEFTHADGWAVTHFAPLRTIVSVAGYRPRPMFVQLQYGSTVAGLVALAICFLWWYKRANKSEVVLRPNFAPAVKSVIVCVMLATAVVLGYVNGASWYGKLLGGGSHRLRFVLGFAITTTTVAAVELFGFSLIWRTFLRTARVQPDRLDCSSSSLSQTTSAKPQR